MGGYSQHKSYGKKIQGLWLECYYFPDKGNDSSELLYKPKVPIKCQLYSTGYSDWETLNF